jgi:hypothetical protein
LAGRKLDAALSERPRKEADPFIWTWEAPAWIITWKYNRKGHGCQGEKRKFVNLCIGLLYVFFVREQKKEYINSLDKRQPFYILTSLI